MIWEEEQVPDDWTKGILVKLPKKGDRLERHRAAFHPQQTVLYAILFCTE